MSTRSRCTKDSRGDRDSPSLKHERAHLDVCLYSYECIYILIHIFIYLDSTRRIAFMRKTSSCCYARAQFQKRELLKPEKLTGSTRGIKAATRVLAKFKFTNSWAVHSDTLGVILGYFISQSLTMESGRYGGRSLCIHKSSLLQR